MDFCTGVTAPPSVSVNLQTSSGGRYRHCVPAGRCRPPPSNQPLDSKEGSSPKHEGRLLFLSLHIKGLAKEVRNPHNANPGGNKASITGPAKVNQTMAKCPLGMTLQGSAIRESGDALIRRLRFGCLHQGYS